MPGSPSRNRAFGGEPTGDAPRPSETLEPGGAGELLGGDTLAIFGYLGKGFKFRSKFVKPKFILVEFLSSPSHEDFYAALRDDEADYKPRQAFRASAMVNHLAERKR